MKVHLSEIAHTRSGDKGDTCNIGVIANEDRYYSALVAQVTSFSGPPDQPRDKSMTKGTASVTGRVVAADTGRPVRRAIWAA